MRTEHDTMGAVQVPDNAYYGAQTQRAVENFSPSGKGMVGKTMPPELIHALGLVKWACAKANADLGLLQSGRSPLTDKQIGALLTACLEVAEGKFDDQFPVDVYQTGSGTSTNMNANEVIARRANEIFRIAPQRSRDRKNAIPIHPNDHVNMGQSSNDIFPTAIHVALLQQMILFGPTLLDAHKVLLEKSEKWKDIMKIGRTHLADATPMTLGQEFRGFAEMVSHAFYHLWKTTEEHLIFLPVGGTAIGTGINTHAEFGKRVAKNLNIDFPNHFFPNKSSIRETPNHFAGNAQRDSLVAFHASVKSAAVSLFNIANNIRWLGSGPRAGFYEIIIPDLQPGSSMMPGKVNPVLCEALMQACARVIGNDQTMTFCGATGGQFQLNVMMPVMADTAIESVKILSGALEVFTEKCLKGLEANEEKCREGVEKSLSMATALNPYIGYEKAAEIAKEAFRTGKTVREVCLEWNVLPPEQLAEVLDPWKMIRPKG